MASEIWMRKILAISIIIGFSFIAIVGLWIRTSLPQLHGTISKVGIKSSVEVIRDESWLHWRLIECPYKKDIYFFEYKNNFAIVHIFATGNVKKLNVLYTYAIDNPDEETLFTKIINWAVNNNIDLVWAVKRNKEFKKIFPKIINKSINFASWSSDNQISEILQNGLLDPQGIDSDIDSNLYIE